jgi:hypothetical protein
LKGANEKKLTVGQNEMIKKCLNKVPAKALAKDLNM